MDWIIEKTDEGGITVFECAPSQFDTYCDTELEALDLGIDYAAGIRSAVAANIADMKRRRRALLKSRAR